MADSLTKMGSFELFGLEPNWSSDISVEHLLSRRMLQYAGTPTTLEDIAPEIPIALDLEFLCWDKQREFDLITFFVSKKGQANRFWLKHPAAAFTLKTSASAGAAGIYCKRNSFDLVWQGYERVYILMSSGDLVVRKITSCSGGSDYTYIGFDTVLDRDLMATNHLRISRMLLGRFSTDKLKIKSSTDLVGRASLSFVELVKEYSLAD